MKSRVTFKKFVTFLISVAISASVFPAAYAENNFNFSDFPTGWSKEAVTAAVNNGLLNGYENNEIRPKSDLTRAEFAAIITRAFGAKTVADISEFTDVKKSAWYYDAIAKAVQMRVLNGTGSNTMHPEKPITRQEVFTAVARALVLSSDDYTSLNRFIDKENISDYAKEYMAALSQRGYVNGDEFNNSNPKKNITREEFVQFLHNTIKTYITAPGTYSGKYDGIVVVRVGDVTFDKYTSEGDFVLGDGVLEDNAFLDNITINGRFLVRGGKIKITTIALLEDVIVNNVNGITYFDNYRSIFNRNNIVENTVAKFKEPSGTVSGGSGGITKYTVHFYNGYTTDESALLDEVVVNENETVSQLPEVSKTYYKNGYTKDDNISSLYNGTTYTKTSKPEFYYVDEHNKLAIFDENVVIKNDTNVFSLTDKLDIFFSIDGTPFKVYSYYDDQTRVLDSAKDIAFNGRQQLKLALAGNMIPEYDEIKNAFFGKLKNVGIIDNNRNIQIISIDRLISDLISRDITDKMVRQYIRDAVASDDNNKLDIISDLIVNVLNNDDDFDEFINNTMVKDHIETLDDEEKIDFADKIHSSTKNTTEYPIFIEELYNEEFFDVTEENMLILKVVSGAIEELDLVEALTNSNNGDIEQLIDIIGRDIINNIFEDVKSRYCDGLNDEIESVENTGIDSEYTTTLTIRINIIEDLYKPLYQKAFDKVLPKIENSDILHYNDNDYLQYLVNMDLLTKLLDGDSSLAAGDDTGYSIKGLLDYYDFILELLFVGDDALCWYGDPANSAQIDDELLNDIYDAITQKAIIVHEKVDEMLEKISNSSQISGNIKKVLDGVKKINDMVLPMIDNMEKLIDKYKNSDFANSDQTIADILIGTEDPTITVDTLYDILFRFDDNIQQKLAQYITNDKLIDAIDRFEASPLASLFTIDGMNNDIVDKRAEFLTNGKIETPFASVYDLLVILSEYGLEPFENDLQDLTLKDSYTIKLGKVEIRIKRILE